jgi:hypothetical protein
MLYTDLRLLILSFVEHKSFGPIKKCFLIMRIASESFDERGIGARLGELDQVLKQAFIPNNISIETAVNHSHCMDEMWYNW